MKKKLMAVALATIIAVMAVAGASLAWLTDSSEKVENTFTVGNITIELKETTSDYKVVPGGTDAKNPSVTVKEKSEKCYVYVLIDNQLVIDGVTVATLDIISTNWIEVSTTGTQILYRYKEAVDASSADVVLPVFTTVKYNGTLITSDNIGGLASKKIVLKAFAHQSENIDNIDVANNAAETWATTAFDTP